MCPLMAWVAPFHEAASRIHPSNSLSRVRGPSFAAMGRNPFGKRFT